MIAPNEPIDFAKLREAFDPKDIEWRVQQAGAKNGKPWAKVLAYLTNRAIMARLDDVVGPGNWRNEYRRGPDGGVMCGIAIRIGEEWVTKWDGASNTDIEAVKGGLSNAMKRAAVQWGIGRYLYDLTTNFANVHPDGEHWAAGNKEKGYDAFYWDPPELPLWAKPKGYEPPKREKASGKKTEKAPESKDSPAAKGEFKRDTDTASDFSIAMSTIQNAHDLRRLAAVEKRLIEATNDGKFTHDEFTQLEAALLERRTLITPAGSAA